MNNKLLSTVSGYWLRFDLFLPINALASLGNLIQQAYCDEHRYYHNDTHISEGLMEYTRIHRIMRLSPTNRLLLFLMWLFHDAVNDPEANDNESQSAIMFVQFARHELKLSKALVRMGIRGILATDHKIAPSDELSQILCDIDLVRLACPWDEFERHTANLRLEKAHLNDDQFRVWQITTLRMFLDRQSIYLTDDFRTRYEAPARTNLTRALAELEASP